MEDNSLNLIETFAEFKEFKNIDRETLMRILEDVFRSALTKKYGSDAHFEIIVNVDRGDLEIQRYREIVEDGEVENYTDPDLIHDRFGSRVWAVVDGGIADPEPSTIVDCSDGIELVRQGKGEIDL